MVFECCLSLDNKSILINNRLFSCCKIHDNVNYNLRTTMYPPSAFHRHSSVWQGRKIRLNNGLQVLYLFLEKSNKLFALNIWKNINSRLAIPLCTFYRHSYSVGVFNNIGELLSYQGYHNKHEKGVEEDVDEEKRNIELSSRLLGLLIRQQNCTNCWP